ncbi:uncharacterized protein THITE_156659 [Thermothielavioides terrestris NRRL 8126]|uniref:Uncharacterized protein n=1 Tax=Thermothielavioides terrestris (strain ATCC 38088 / NRRL 8126) TaxID=578455 RepID=G2RDD4_THETT|nr:uncharacterized protein THITE_156659 [Thermothielavioides terrestris NRRL 8126]AEO70773.1 hypothetical protein THITE_156659 [Thermothielavioides terrestris NRRL 8126]
MALVPAFDYAAAWPTMRRRGPRCGGVAHDVVAWPTITFRQAAAAPARHPPAAARPSQPTAPRKSTRRGHDDSEDRPQSKRFPFLCVTGYPETEPSPVGARELSEAEVEGRDGGPQDDTTQKKTDRLLVGLGPPKALIVQVMLPPGDANAAVGFMSFGQALGGIATLAAVYIAGVLPRASPAEIQAVMAGSNSAFFRGLGPVLRELVACAITCALARMFAVNVAATFGCDSQAFRQTAKM